MLIRSLFLFLLVGFWDWMWSFFQGPIFGVEVSGREFLVCCNLPYVAPTFGLAIRFGQRPICFPSS